MTQFRLDMTRGDDRTLTVTATHPETGAPYPLDGKTLWFTAKLSVADATNFFQKKTGAGIQVVSGNVASVKIDGADTEDLPGRAVLVCDVQVKDGSDVYTVAEGALTVRPDVTRERS